MAGEQDTRGAGGRQQEEMELGKKWGAIEGEELGKGDEEEEEL